MASCWSLAVHEGRPLFQSLVDMAPKYILEQFLQQELLINITEHEVGGCWGRQRCGPRQIVGGRWGCVRASALPVWG